MPKTAKSSNPIYILTSASGQYEDYSVSNVGLTSKLSEAEAWKQTGVFDPNDTHDYEVMHLDKLEGAALNHVTQWLDPKSNPMCECGHRLLHHRGGKKRSCRYNSKYPHNRHECKEFRLAETQPGL